MEDAKEQSYQFLRELAMTYPERTSLCLKDLRNENATAVVIAENLSCSRNLISHYMNKLIEEGSVIKVNTRPVYFFAREELQQRYDISLDQDTYDSLEILYGILTKQKSNAFSDLIGAKESLSYVVEQCKAAVTYPGNGLPILLQGPTGTGKSMIARLLYDYGIEKGIIAKEKRFVTVNCSEYTNNPELLMTNLFGFKKGAYTGADKDTKGLLALADGGILFMDEVHGLKPECQEKIFLFMDKGIYHMVGDNDTWYQSQVRLIFATTEKPDEVLLKTLLRRIPLIVTVPSLKERPLYEKRELIHFLIQQEEKHIKKPIVISSMAYQALENHEFVGNIGALKNSIRAATAKAFLREESQSKIALHLYDFGNELVSNMSEFSNFAHEDHAMMSTKELLNDVMEDHRYTNFNQQIIRQYHRISDSKTKDISFVDTCCMQLEQYIDSLSLQDTYAYTNYSMMQNLLKNIANIVVHKYQIEPFSNNELSVMARILCEYKQNISAFIPLKQSYGKELTEIIAMLQHKHPRDMAIVTDLWKLIQDALAFQSDQFGIIDLFLLMHYFNRELEDAQIPVVIVAHGYSIASGIAEVANQLLKQHIFDAIDMPIESDFDVIVERISAYIKRRSNASEIIVMVDMGSLEEIYRDFETIDFRNIGVINNVTTKLALDIGNMILEGMGIKEILKEASDRNQHRYVIVENKRKQNAILSVCETGIGTAEKISTLIKSSLPKDVDIVLIPYEYGNLRRATKHSLVFEKYNILFIVGTKNPGIELVPYISLEEMITQTSVDKTNMYLHSVMNKEQIEVFNANMIKNFSLDNLLDYLTILDSEKIISSVETIIIRMQQELQIKFSSSVILGLYIHISCLIERLIIGQDETVYEHLDEFQREHQEFIHTVKQAFQDVEAHYHVFISDGEIGYIYEYIFAHDSVKESYDSVNELWDPEA